MADLAVEFFGLRFASPVWAAAGPNTRDGERVRRQAEGGAGSAVCKTISGAAAPVPKFHMMNLATNRRGGMLNSELWSELPPEAWLSREYAVALASGVPVIASLGYTREDVVRLGAAAERAGVQALEVTVHYAREEPWRVMKALREAVSLPIIAKLSPHDPATVIDAAVKMEPYVDGFAAVNSLGPCLRIDVETGKRVLATEHGFGWLSGPPIKPLALRVVFDLARSVARPVIGVGGVRTGRDVVEFLMAGASAVQVCTQNILEGPGCFARINGELNTWLDGHGYRGARELTGLYLRNLGLRIGGGAAASGLAGAGAGDAGPTGGSVDAEGGSTGPRPASGAPAGVGTAARVHLSGPPPRVIREKCNLCDLCAVACPYDALRVDKAIDPDAVILDATRCFVCGLCVTVCPTGALALDLDPELGPAGAIRP